MKKRLLSALLVLCMVCTFLPASVLAATPADHAIKLELVKDTATFSGKEVLRVDFMYKSGTDTPSNQMVYLKVDAAKLDILNANTGNPAKDAVLASFSDNKSDALTKNNYSFYDEEEETTKKAELVLYPYKKDGKLYLGWKVTEPSGTSAFANFTRISSIFFGLKEGVAFDAMPKDVIKLATVADDKDVTNQTNSISITTNGSEALKYGSETPSEDNLSVDVGALFAAGEGVTFAEAPKPALGGSVTITGTPKIDGMLTANTSGITSAAPLGALTYKWYRVGETTPISGANTDTYTPSVAADVGKQIKVEVSAANYSGSITATTTNTVEKADGPSAPAAPTESSKTANSITVSHSGTGLEFACVTADSDLTGASWQENKIFNGLVANTKYDIYARAKETATHKAGDHSSKLTVTTEKAAAAITIAEPGTIVYDGSAVEAGSGKDLSYTYNGDGDVTVKWYADNSGVMDSELIGGAPTNAGTYWIGVSAAEGTNSAAVAEVTKQFTISQKALTDSMITLSTQKIYNGTEQGVQISSVKDGEANLISTIDYTIEAGGKAINVEDTTLVIKGMGNYTGEASATWSLAAREVTITPNVGQSKTYGEADPELTYSTDISDETLVAKFNEAKSGALSYTGTDACTYPITLGSLAAGNNFNLKLAAATVNFEIKKADQTITGDGFSARIGSTVDLSGKFGASGTLSYEIIGTNTTGSSVSGSTLTVGSTAGSFQLKVSAAATTNYKAAEKTVTVTVNAKDPQTITASDSMTVTYGETDKSVSATASGTIIYSVKSGSEEYIEVDASTGALTIKKVGTAYVTVKAAETAEYAEATKDITLTIQPKQIAAPAADSTVYTYTGSAQTYGITATTDYTVTNGTQTNANETGYTVTVALADKTNTVWADTNTAEDKPYSFVIKKATPAGTPSYTAIATSGKTLANAALTIGSITPVGGTIAWNVADTTVVAANTAYGWTYTPTDTANYNPLTGSITPYVVSYSGGGGGSYTPSYTVSVDKTENGTITVSPKSASKGDTVTITVKPDKGYELDTLKVLDKNGDKVKLTEKNGKYTFTMPTGKVTVKGSFAEEAPEQIFADVPMDAYYYEAVKWAAEKGITGGIGNDLFAPNRPCTRAQIVTFLWRAAGSPEPKAMSSFADVAAGSYYAKAVAWAVENGITSGTGDGKFSPDAACTRAQAVTFLFRALSAKAAGKAEFSDVPADSYFAEAVAWAAAKGVTTGVGGDKFAPTDGCTRAQIVTFLYRAYNK